MVVCVFLVCTTCFSGATKVSVKVFNHDRSRSIWIFTKETRWAQSALIISVSHSSSCLCNKFQCIKLTIVITERLLTGLTSKDMDGAFPKISKKINHQ